MNPWAQANQTFGIILWVDFRLHQVLIECFPQDATRGLAELRKVAGEKELVALLSGEHDSRSCFIEVIVEGSVSAFYPRCAPWTLQRLIMMSLSVGFIVFDCLSVHTILTLALSILATSSLQSDQRPSLLFCSVFSGLPWGLISSEL